MKRFFTLIVLVAAMAVTVQAQGVKFGVKGGLNITKMSFSEDVIKSDNQTGFYLGPTLKFSLPLVGLGVDVAALYDQRSAEVASAVSSAQTSNSTEKITQKSINIPINLRYNIGLGGAAGIYLAAGPQFGFNVGDKEIKLDNYSEYTMRSSNFSVNLGAGVFLLKHLEIGFSYNIALGKTGEVESVGGVVSDAYKNIDSRANAWQIGAAIYF